MWRIYLSIGLAIFMLVATLLWIYGQSEFYQNKVNKKIKEEIENLKQEGLL